jgi:hypothetical protein
MKNREIEILAWVFVSGFVFLVTQEFRLGIDISLFLTFILPFLQCCYWLFKTVYSKKVNDIRVKKPILVDGSGEENNI